MNGVNGANFQDSAAILDFSKAFDKVPYTRLHNNKCGVVTILQTPTTHLKINSI